MGPTRTKSDYDHKPFGDVRFPIGKVTILPATRKTQKVRELQKKRKKLKIRRNSGVARCGSPNAIKQSISEGEPLAIHEMKAKF